MADADARNQAAFDRIVDLHGGLPVRCDLCGQVFTDVRYPILEDAGELVCKECYVRLGYHKPTP